jgi:hypothetical protein
MPSITVNTENLLTLQQLRLGQHKIALVLAIITFLSIVARTQDIGIWEFVETLLEYLMVIKDMAFHTFVVFAFYVAYLEIMKWVNELLGKDVSNGGVDTIMGAGDKKP